MTREFDFIRIPKELFRNPYYGSLSPEGKLLYGFLLDRASLSWASGEKWRTPDGDPFVIFTIEEICQRLSCADKKATRLLKSLVTHNLIRLSRPKKDGPYHIKVLPFDRPKERLDNRQIDACPPIHTTTTQPSKQRHNNTERNNTDMNKTERITQLEREMKTHIQYDYLISQYPKNQVDTIVEVMVQTLSSSANSITVGGVPMDAELVRGYLQKTEVMRIQYIFDHMDQLAGPIGSYRAYFLARLCDPEGAVDAFYEALQKQYAL